MRFVTLLLLMLTAACGRDDTTSIADMTRQRLQAEYDSRLAAFQQLPTNECDGALWAGMARRAGINVDVASFLSDSGRPMRRSHADCLASGPQPTSVSTTSNDMITGLILGLLAASDQQSLGRLWDYGVSHSWIMGSPEAELSRVLLKPNGIILLAQTRYFLSAANIHLPERDLPILYFPVQFDFEKQLQFISLQIQKDVGANPDVAKLIICHVRDLTDALNMVVCGDPQAAANLLLNDYRYPGYVRGADAYKDVHWLLAAKLVLESH